MDASIQNKINALLDAKSLYPELPRKSRAVRERELIEWYYSYNEVNQVYNLYGLDTEDAPSCDDYLDRGIFGRRRYLFNSDFRPLAYPDESKYSYSYAIFGRDKFAFDAFLSWALDKNDNYLPLAGAIMGGRWFIKGIRGIVEESFDSFVTFLDSYNHKKLVFKTAFGAGAHGVKVVQIDDGFVLDGNGRYSYNQFFYNLAKPNINWIVQDYLVQHKDMARLNESSVNTMRLVTFNTGSRVVLAPQVAVRIGKPGSTVDNECFYSHVDDKGIISDDAFSYFEMLRLPAHCKGWKIPYYKEAQELVKRLHILLPGLFTIGWDVAIGETGPVIIEANDGWEPFLNQTKRGNGMRELWRRMEAERIDYLGYEPCEPSERD